MALTPHPTYPKILDEPPAPADSLSHYDMIHALLFARLLSSADAGTDWQDAARQILLRDVGRDVEGARRCWETHLARARWLVTEGVRIAARGGQPAGDDLSDYPAVPIPEELIASPTITAR